MISFVTKLKQPLLRNPNVSFVVLCEVDLFLSCSCWVLRCSLTYHVLSAAFYIEREKSDKFCSEALISAWSSSTCRKSTTRDRRDVLTSFPKEVLLRIFTTWKIHRPRPGLNPRTSDPVASMITTGPLGWTLILRISGKLKERLEIFVSGL